MSNRTTLDRRGFLKTAAAVTLAALPETDTPASSLTPDSKITVGVIGCGSVSGSYLPELLSQSHIEVVSVCDIIPERAEAASIKFNIPHAYPHVDQQLSGAPFQMLVNLTSMPSHYPVNRAGLLAGRHVWSEKPMATEVTQGQELIQIAKDKGIGFWAAPTCVTSPQFAFMSKTIAAGKLGPVVAAHAMYGHAGELWSPWFFQKGGGCLYDLGVYNVTTLTGLLGPAKSVLGVTGIVKPIRTVEGKPVTVDADDNTMLLIDHGNATFSHIQTGFAYFTDHHHLDTTDELCSIDIMGTNGMMRLCGYDWAPHGVLLATKETPKPLKECQDPGPYTWQFGVSYVTRCMLSGERCLITPEHGLHVLEVMNACHESQRTGQRVQVHSSFPWPIVT